MHVVSTLSFHAGPLAGSAALNEVPFEFHHPH